MSQCTFSYLCDELRSSIEKNDTEMRKAIPTDMRVALTLWFLATGADYRTIGHLFGVSKSTVCLVSKEVSSAIVKLLLPRYILFPTGAALREVVDGFKNEYGFPQCAGAVDGSHIPIISSVGMYSRCDYPLFVYFLILPSLLHSSILFNCFYTCLYCILGG